MKTLSIKTSAMWIAAITIAVAGCSHKTDEGKSGNSAPPLPVLQVTTLKTGTIKQTLLATATLVPASNMEAVVSPSISGILELLPVRFGDSVTKGQVVAKLSTASVLGQIQQAQANLRQCQIQVQQAQVGALEQKAAGHAALLQAESAVSNARATLIADEAQQTGLRATLLNAKQNLDRLQTLDKSGLVAQKDIEAAQLAERTAQSQVDAGKQTIVAQQQTVDGQIHAQEAAATTQMQDEIKQKDILIAQQQVANARGQLATAQTQLGYCTLIAPLGGRVTSIGANAGELVDPSTKIITVANLKQVQLQVAVPGEKAALVHAGQPVSFTVTSRPGKTFYSTIQAVGTQIDTASGTVTAVAQVPNPHGDLNDDQLASATIVLRSVSGVVLVPRSAILTDSVSGATSVAVVGDDDVVHIKPVKTGLESSDVVQAVSGVTPGSRVAVYGQYAVPDGTKVSVRS